MSTQLSAILYAPVDFDNVRRTISHLQSQEGPDIELILVAPPGVLPADLAFPPLKLCVLETEPNASSATAWSRAIQVASSPIIVFTEDHAFPDPGWAEALVKAHEDDWHAVGPSVENANADSTLSRADMLMNFLDQYQRPEGPSSKLMGHNTSYKREVLSSLSLDRLNRAMQCEILLHSEWGEQRCLHLPKACVRHVNISKPIPFVLHKIFGGMVFGGERCREWSFRRRLAYIFGSWAIPFLRAYKIQRALASSPQEKRAHYRSCWGWLALALVLHAVGETIGYLGGPAIAEKAYRRYSLFEQRRWEMVRPEDLGLKNVPLHLT